jgi:stage II sporulation protein AA (anti-sigma F factor antagonist)
MIGDRHPAFDADADSRPRLGLAREELLEDGHGFSRFHSFLRRKKRAEGLPNPQKSCGWACRPGGRIIRGGLSAHGRGGRTRCCMAMTLSEQRIGDVTLLRLGGRIVFGDGAPELRTHINDLIDEARLKFLIDLEDVTYMDSFGVGVIAAKYVSVRRKGGDMKLLCLSPRTHRVMRISGLLKILESFESKEDGLRSFGITA